jgi:D-3-phosphoglycerate dehydrogenase
VRALVLAPFTNRQLDRLRGFMPVAYESWTDTKRLQDPDELGARLAAEDIGVLIVEADFVFEEVFAAAPCLRLVGVCRNALNQVDIVSATAHGVAVTHARGRNTNAVAEMTLGLMFALVRRVPEAHAFVASGKWRDPSAGYRSFRGREIAGSTIGIVGFGQIGREVTRLCVALGARVLVHDPFVPDAHVRAAGARPATLASIAKAADFISLHVPDGSATRHLVDAAFLAKMKPDAYLINTSGGAVVDPAALVEALAAHTIAGAALDVFAGQPLPLASPLLNAPNLILTPHIGGATAETIERHSRMMVDEVARLIAGKRLRHVVNPEYAGGR